MYSWLAVSKRAISASSWAKARMRRAPEKFSWAWALMSENMAWMRSKRLWMRAPNCCTRMDARGERDEGDEGEPRAEAIHLGQRGEHEQKRIGRVHDGRAEKLADGGEVVGGAGHDVAGAVGLVELGGLALEVGEDVVAEVELDFSRGADEHLSGGVERDAGEGGEAEQREAVHEDAVRGGVVLHVVDRVAYDGRHGDFDEVVEHGRDAAAGEVLPVAPEVGGEGFQAVEHGDWMWVCGWRFGVVRAKRRSFDSVHRSSRWTSLRMTMSWRG